LPARLIYETTRAIHATNLPVNCYFAKERKMSHRSHRFASLFLASALGASLAGVACSEHHAYRVYDPYYTDYHVWNSGEVVYYNRWADETRRDRNRDFRKLPPEEQKEYWTWRHNRGDRDRDHDHDKGHN
jgi:protein-tyrosine phosphatase